MPNNHAEEEEEGKMFPKVRKLFDKAALEQLGQELEAAKGEKESRRLKTSANLAESKRASLSFRNLASWTARVSGRPAAFTAAVAVVLIWAKPAPFSTIAIPGSWL